MVCIYCPADTKVINSRHQKRANQVWRRRQCMGCKAIFTTIEAPDTHQSLIVTSSGSQARFARDRLLVSVAKALSHRDAYADDASALTDTIVAKLLALKSPIITDAQITEVTATTLGAFDQLAALKYRQPSN